MISHGTSVKMCGRSNSNQSAREKRPEAEGYFKSAQKMAADASAPKELQELGRALQRIMIGDRNVDLSSLPREWAEAVRKAMEE